MDDTTNDGGGTGPDTGVPSQAGVALASRAHLTLAELMAGSLEDQIVAIEALTGTIATADPITESARYGATFLGRAALRTHRITQTLTGAQLDWMGLEAEAGVWDTSKGFRTYPNYVAKTYGMSATHARRTVSLAKGLRDVLPATRRHLRTGLIGTDHAEILLKATHTPVTTDALQEPAVPTDGIGPTGTVAGPGPESAESTGDGAEDASATGTADGGTADTNTTDDDTANTSTADSGAADTDGAEDVDAPGTGLTVEELLLEHAASKTPEDLRRVVNHFIAVSDPDTADGVHHAAADREFLNIDRTLDGYHLAGFLTIENGQYVRTALEAVMGKPATGDTRTSSQRRAQALADLAHTNLDHGTVGKSASVRPHLGVLVDFTTFVDLASAADHAGAGAGQAGTGQPTPTGTTTGCSAIQRTVVPAPRPVEAPLPGLDLRGTGPLIDIPTDPAVLIAETELPTCTNGTALPGTTGTSASTAPGTTPPTTTGTALPSTTPPTTTGTALPSTTPPTTTGTALPGTTRTSASGTTPPTTGTALPGTAGSSASGDAAAAATTLGGGGRDWRALLSVNPATFTDNTGPVPRDLLERIIGCAGETYRIVFGPDHEVINHGRAHRLYTAPQRRALIARDHHCVHPDCTVPPERCESHHASGRWSDGTPTDLHCAALLCYYHHHWVHTHNITMVRRDGTWHFHRPDGTEIRPTTPWT